MDVMKCKLTATGVSINYKSGKDIISLTSKEEARPELSDCMQGFSNHVIKICELPKDAKIKVSGVSISRNEDFEDKEVRGVVITAKCELQKSTGMFVINTPHRIERFYGEGGDEGQLMSDGMKELLDEFEAEVKKYINGERAQVEMFDEQADERMSTRKAS